MPKLVKLEGNGDVSNYTPAEGYVTTFLAWNNGNVQLRLKNSAGQIATFEKQAVPVAVQPVPDVNIDLDKMTITASYTPVAGKVEDTADRMRVIPLQSASTEPPQIEVGTDGKITAHYFLVGGGTIKENVQPKAELQLPVIEGQEITPGIEEKSLTAGSFLTGDVTIVGDENLIPENIKNGTSIFGVTGSLTGGAFDLVAVTSYAPAYANITSLQLSGMGMDEMSGTDFSAANGVYTVTDDTASLPANKKVFKHNSAEYYIAYIPESADGMYYSYGWCLANKAIVTDPWNAYMIGPKELAEGTSYWQDEMGMTYQNVTVSNIQSTEMPPDVKIRRVTGYSPSTLQYTFAGEEESCSAVDSSTLREHQIYNFDGTSIIGRPIDCEGGSHLRTYIPGRTAPVTSLLKNDRNSYTNNNYFPAWQYPTFRTSEPNRFSLATIDGKSCIYSNTGAETISLANADDYGSGIYGYYPSTADRQWSFGALFHSGNQKNCNQRIFCQIAKQVSIDAEWRESTPRVVVRVDDTVVITYTASGLSSGWHHVLLTYDWNAKKLTLYVDGSARGTHSESVSSENGFTTCYFGVGRNIGEWYIGHVCEIKFWDIPLSAEQAMAEYNRAINS